MKPPVEASGIKFFLDSQGELFISFIGGESGRDFLKLFSRCWQKWARGDFAGTIYAGQTDDKGTCRQSGPIEANTSPGQPPALLAEIAATVAPPASTQEAAAGEGQALPATPISGSDEQMVIALIASYESTIQQQAAQIASLQAQLEANSAVLRQIAQVEEEFAEIHAERASV